MYVCRIVLVNITQIKWNSRLNLNMKENEERRRNNNKQAKQKKNKCTNNRRMRSAFVT